MSISQNHFVILKNVLLLSNLIRQKIKNLKIYKLSCNRGYAHALGRTAEMSRRIIVANNDLIIELSHK